MENLTFEQLPGAVALLLEKVSRLETLLENRPEAKEVAIRMLNVTEAAELLHISVQALYTKVSRREVPVYKPGRRLYFNREELLEWMMGGRRKTNTEIQWEAERHLVDLGRKRKARRF
jgi:excisionase family DNA binding protein